MIEYCFIEYNYRKDLDLNSLHHFLSLNKIFYFPVWWTFRWSFFCTIIKPLVLASSNLQMESSSDIFMCQKSGTIALLNRIWFHCRLEVLWPLSAWILLADFWFLVTRTVAAFFSIFAEEEQSNASNLMPRILEA